jgi:hypothetical protein
VRRVGGGGASIDNFAMRCRQDILPSVFLCQAYDIGLRGLEWPSTTMWSALPSPTPLAFPPFTSTRPPLLVLLLPDSALMRPTGYATLPNLDLAKDQAPIYSIRKPA